jgi:hypothetical protein
VAEVEVVVVDQDLEDQVDPVVEVLVGMHQVLDLVLVQVDKVQEVPTQVVVVVEKDQAVQVLLVLVAQE